MSHRRGDEGGFSLVETVIALVVFSLIMASLAGVFISSLRGISQLRDRQQAAALASQALEIARSVQAAPDSNGCPKLVQGRSQTAVAAQWASAPAAVDLSTTDSAWMPPACSGGVVLPLQGLARVAGGAPIDPVPVAGENYTVQTYVGTCLMLVAGGPCLPSAGVSGSAATLYRVVASVTWGQPGCGAACTYSAATLIDPSTDPLFNARSTVPGAPVNLAAVPGDGTAAMSWSAPTTNTDVPVLTYAVTATPLSGGTPATCTVAAPSTTCTLTGLTDGLTYSATVTAKSAYAGGAPSGAVQFIPYPASVMTSARTALWLDGADATTLIASATCTGAPATTTVGCWKDKSTKADNAVQSTTASMPSLTTVAGRQVPRFDGSASSLALTPALLPTGTTTGTVVAVAALTDPSPGTSALRSVLNYGTLLSGQARQLQKLANSSSRVVSVGTNAVQGTWTASPGVLVGEFTASTITNWPDGATGTTVTGLTNSTGTTYARVGSSGTPSQFWYGPIPEVIVFTGALTTTERRSVEEYLARKWGSAIVPGAPTGVTGTATGSATANVSFTAPAFDGGSPVTSYTVVATPASGPVVTTTGCTGTPCAVTGLTAATTYTVTVAAVNALGTGATSAPASVTTTSQLPGAPTGVSATAGDTTATVTWTAPAVVGTGITGYTVTATPSAGSGYGAAPVRTCSTAGPTSCTVTGLTDGLTYAIAVTASNAAGAGAASTTVSVLPYPSAILSGTGLRLWLDGADSSTLFQDTAMTTPVTAAGQYVAAWKDKSAQASTVLAPGTVSTTSPTADSTTFPGRTVPVFSSGRYLTRATGFPASSDYSLATVYRSTNAGCYNNIVSGVTNHAFYVNLGAGLRVFHNSSVVGTTAGATANTAYVGTGTYTNATKAATVDVNAAPVVSGTLTTGNTDATIQIGAYANSYGFCGQIAEVQAFNRVLSAAERRTVQEYLARKWLVAITPTAPTAVVATPANTTASIAFTPDWDGGSATTSYTVVAVPTTGPTVTLTGCTGSPCSLTGLVAGMTYSVTVTAVNAIGAGPASAAVPMTTYSLPGAPTGLVATAGDTSVGLTWTAPAVTGGGSLSYTATAVPGDGSANVTCTTAATSCSLSGLTNGVTYTVTVTATNPLGAGPASASAAATPYPASVMTAGATQLWLDGADPATLLASSACTGAAATTTIGCWKDKSASADNAIQATAANQANLSSLNGRTAATFDGTSDSFGLTVAKLPTGTTPSAVYVVAVQEDAVPTASCYRAALAWGSAATGAARTVEKGCNTSTAYLDTYATSGSMSATKAWGVNATSVFDGTVTSSAVTANLNGAANYTYSGAANTGTAAGAFVGSGAAAYYWKGRIAEVVVLSGIPSAAGNRAVEEYLARKWAGAVTPSAPTGVGVTPLATTASVAFTPGWDGGSTITSYTVVATPSSGPVVTLTGCAASPCTLTGLAAGTAYTVTVSAVNAVGGGPTGSGAFTTLTPPGPPTAVAATPGDGTLAVSWTAPAVTGGGITGYTVTSTPTAGSGYASAPTLTCTTGGATSCTLSGAIDGLTYASTVTATSAAGTSSASSAASAVPYPASVMTGSSLQLWLDGNDPDADGLSEGSAESCGTVSCPSAGNVLTRWRDKSGQAHDAVQATTAMAGTFAPATGAVSFSANGYYQASNVAAGPDVTAFAVAQSSTATWNTYGWLVGTRSPNGWVLHPNISASSTQGIAMFGDVTNDQAFNTASQSPSSITALHVYGTQVSGTSTITGTLALDGNVGATSTVTTTGAKVRAAAALTLTVGADDYDLVGRRGSGSYREVVVLNRALSVADRRAVQEYLARKWGPAITPAAPQSVSAVPNGTGSIKATWTAPAWNGGSAVTDYTVQYRTLGSSTWTTWAHTASPSTTATLTGLASGTTYEVQVTGVNALGSGPASSVVQVSAPTVVLAARAGTAFLRSAVRGPAGSPTGSPSGGANGDAAVGPAMPVSRGGVTR